MSPIHDQSYRRYQGSRQPAGHAWRVIAGAGIRAMLPHVDEFRPIHNLASMRGLVEALSRPAPPKAPGGAWRPAGSAQA